MKSLRTFAFALLAATSLAASAHATEYLTASVGAFDVLDNNASTHFGLEYRGERFWRGLLPVVGISGNTDGGVYGYAGLNYDIDLGRQWVLTPSFAVAGYSHGDSHDLGGALEFRSMIEMDYRFENEHRLGVSFGHLSNAGIYDRNPGTEILMLNYSVPMGIFH